MVVLVAWTFETPEIRKKSMARVGRYLRNQAVYERERGRAKKVRAELSPLLFRRKVEVNKRALIIIAAAGGAGDSGMFPLSPGPSNIHRQPIKTPPPDLFPASLLSPHSRSSSLPRCRLLPSPGGPCTRALPVLPLEGAFVGIVRLVLVAGAFYLAPPTLVLNVSVTFA